MTNQFDLSGRTALVTGGSKGIGAEIVRILARNGASVAYCHLGDSGNAEQLSVSLKAEGLKVAYTECDVSSEEHVAKMARWVSHTLGHVDILVNSAGIGGGDKPFDKLTTADWDRVLGVNLRGTYLVTQQFFEKMAERNWGRVVNMASQLAYKGAPGLAHYCAAKAGVVGFTRALSYEGAPRGVMVNAIAPGPVETDLLMAHSDAWLAMKRAQLPIQRFGRVMEIAPTALLLASEAGAYYSGQTLSPNGGDVML